MKSYVEILIVKNVEFQETTLMNAVFSKIHLALVERGKQMVGVSFPKFGSTLGGVVRLHGKADTLKDVVSHPSLRGVRDYINIEHINDIPATTLYRVVQRVQSKSSIDRLLRRSVRKGWITEEEAITRGGAAAKYQVNLPYLKIRSASTGQHFRLFVEHHPLVEAPTLGLFSSYGMSGFSTIPWF